MLSVRKGDIINFEEAALSYNGEIGVCTHYKAIVLSDPHPSHLLRVKETTNNKVMYITQVQITKNHTKQEKRRKKNG